MAYYTTPPPPPPPPPGGGGGRGAAGRGRAPPRAMNCAAPGGRPEGRPYTELRRASPSASVPICAICGQSRPVHYPLSTVLATIPPCLTPSSPPPAISSAAPARTWAPPSTACPRTPSTAAPT